MLKCVFVPAIIVTEPTSSKSNNLHWFYHEFAEVNRCATSSPLTQIVSMHAFYRNSHRYIENSIKSHFYGENRYIL